MKKIFKSLIVINYTQNPDNLSVEALKEYISEENIYETDYLDELLEQSQEVLKGLINSKFQNKEDILELASQIEGTEIQDHEAIYKIWQKEKDSIYDYLIQKSSSCDILESINWSLHQKSYGRHVKNKKISSVIFDFQLNNLSKQQQQKHQTFTFEMNTEKFQEFCQEVGQIDNMINELLQQ